MAAAKTTGLEVIDERDSKALTAPMTMMDDVGIVRDADGMYEMTSDSGRIFSRRGTIQHRTAWRYVVDETAGAFRIKLTEY